MIDLLDAAVGAVTSVGWAHHDQPDLWRFGLVHEGGAHSTVTLSMQLPIDPSEIEFAVFGPDGIHRLAGRSADPRTCFAALLPFWGLTGETIRAHMLSVVRERHGARADVLADVLTRAARDQHANLARQQLRNDVEITSGLKAARPWPPNLDARKR